VRGGCHSWTCRGGQRVVVACGDSLPKGLRFEGREGQVIDITVGGWMAFRVCRLAGRVACTLGGEGRGGGAGCRPYQHSGEGGKKRGGGGGS